MNMITTVISAASFLFLGLSSATTQAATFSTFKVAGLYGTGHNKRSIDGNEATFTIANATGFAWDDSYFFADVAHVSDANSTGGTHLEFAPSYRL